MPPTSQTVQNRVFPDISPDLYRVASGEPTATTANAAQRLLGLANKPLTFRQKYFGHNLDTTARAGRFLGLHKEALRSELAGEFSRADFFWDRFQTELKDLAERDEFWDELARFLGDDGNGISSPTELRRRLIEEVFVETHLAFYRGYARGGEELPLDSRAFLHFKHVRELLPKLSISGESFFRLVRWPLKAQVKALNASGRWDDALRLCRLILSYAPDNRECQEEMAGVYIASNMAALNDSPDADPRENAKNLLETIEQLEDVRAQYPYNMTIFRLLGHLYHLRSVKLADAGYLSAALVDAEKAVSFYPDNEEAEKSRNEIAELMKRTQAHMQEVGEQMAKKGEKLNTRGRLLQSETAKGFGPLDEYVRSAESKATKEAYLALKAKNREESQLSTPSDDVTSLPVHQQQTSRRGEPFNYWLFGRQHLAVKVRAAVAILLVLTAGGLWAREAQRRNIRDGAYRQIVEAADRHEYPVLIDGAESFLSNPPLRGEDGRRKLVINYYTDALLHLVIQQDSAELSPVVTARLSRYNQLVEGTK